MLILGDHYIRIIFYFASMGVLISIFNSQFSAGSQSELFSEYWHFFVIGIVAATIANATGAGGGIVFLPAFGLLGMTIQEAIATSFAIQCFGMTSGSLTWLGLVRKEQAVNQLRWKNLNLILLLATLASLSGLFFTRYLIPQPPVKIHILFSLFSIVVGLVMLKRSMTKDKVEHEVVANLSVKSSLFIIFSTFVGGGITAWLSIGVGEILVIVLVALGYTARFAIAAAVCISSATVLAAIPSLIAEQNIHYAVLLFAAPAALIGGFVARHLATMVSVRRLKTIFAFWIVASGICYIIIS